MTGRALRAAEASNGSTAPCALRCCGHASRWSSSTKASAYSRLAAFDGAAELPSRPSHPCAPLLGASRRALSAAQSVFWNIRDRQCRGARNATGAPSLEREAVRCEGPPRALAGTLRPPWRSAESDEAGVKPLPLGPRRAAARPSPPRSWVGMRAQERRSEYGKQVHSGATSCRSHNQRSPSFLR